MHGRDDNASPIAELIRVRGHVQGVGFRPTVCRLATQLGLPGWVRNDPHGVLIALGGEPSLRARFLETLLADLPPLARVYELSREPLDNVAAHSLPAHGFSILASEHASAQLPAAQVVPDASVCAACSAEVRDPAGRRYRYPFSNCTHCGPRFSILRALPWDRRRTSLAGFALCDACLEEYESPSDRRYHAEPIACPRCGPRVRLSRNDGSAVALSGADDALAAVAQLLLQGYIVAIKGLGGYQLLADATCEATVLRLRSRKRRPHKPFALMARDLATVSAYCVVSEAERACLCDPSNPIVLLRARTPEPAPALAPALLPELAQRSYGFMLPTTPLHALVLEHLPQPVICTSGNRSEEPQVIDDREAFERLGEIADFVLSHDRPIYNRVDDSVVRVFAGRRRIVRRARGFAPATLALPRGFQAVAQREAVWAAGSDLKSAICMSREHDLVLSQHLGNLDEARSYEQYVQQCERLLTLFEHAPTRIALDNHPESRAAAFAHELAAERALPTHAILHHHAHFAACLADNGVPWDGSSRLGLILDGIGMGDAPGALWGCEVLVGDYERVERFGTLTATALLGGDRAAREPWRCLYAQLRAAYDWQTLDSQYGALRLVQRLRQKPCALLEQLLERELASPRASSCGRLFDAVAAALGICFEAQSFEAQAAQALEALVDDAALERAIAERSAGPAYALPIREGIAAPHQLEARALWPALLADLARHGPTPLLAARFHVSLAAGLAQLCASAARAAEFAGHKIDSVVALSGGCVQNAVLHERLQAELESLGFAVLTHSDVPANDGGLAVGQALVVLAQSAHLHRRT